MLPLLTGTRQQFIVNDTKMGGILNLQLAQGSVAAYSSLFQVRQESLLFIIIHSKNFENRF